MQRSFVESANDPNCPFPLNNLPYGAFTRSNFSNPHLCIAIGDHVLDLFELVSTHSHLFSGPIVTHQKASQIFRASVLNPFLKLGLEAWKEVRSLITNLLSEKNNEFRAAIQDENTFDRILPAQTDVIAMHLPIQIGDYTDFYSSRQHATNVGTMFRGPENALPQSWLHMPIGYHGRASSVVISGTEIHRPCGQVIAPGDKVPKFAPSKRMDFELEMAAVIGGEENPLGTRITMENAGERIFGLMLMNDWSSRDIQKWEYVPLGPFNAKNLGTTVSPWIVTLEALEAMKLEPPSQEVEVLDYLKGNGKDVRGHCLYNIELQVSLQTEQGETPSPICKSNYKNLYWSLAQQIAHHSVTGCNMRPGDIIASGTISGTEESSFGSMLELSWSGKREVKLENCPGISRKFIEDNDTIYMAGIAKGNGYVIGFGQCVGKLLPSIEH